MTTAIVCGGRDYAKAERLHTVLEAAKDRLGLHTIIEGGAGELTDSGLIECGVDILAREWALDHDVSVIDVPADWDRLGKSAGPRRNGEMLQFLKAAEGKKIVIAFPGGTRTADMCRRAQSAGIKVSYIDWKGPGQC